MKAVFTVNPSKGLQDPPKCYHFRDRFLPIVEQAVGDNILYCETTGGGGKAGYVAIATVSSVVPDSKKEGFSFAKIKGYKPFVKVVPFKDHYETVIRKMPKKKIGFYVQANPIREIPDSDFQKILRKGMRK